MEEKKKILLAENERIISLDLKKMLELHNYQVLDIVFNSSIIQSYIVKQRPDLFLSGVKGNINFISLIQKITGEYRIPVLIVTGVPEHQLSELKKIQGCSFLMKPYEHEQLIKAVEERLRSPVPASNS